MKSRSCLSGNPRPPLCLCGESSEPWKLGSFCTIAARPTPLWPRPTRHRRELGSFCTIGLVGARPEGRGEREGRPAPPSKLGSFCAFSARPTRRSRELASFCAFRPARPRPTRQIGFVLRISSAGAWPPGEIGFVLHNRQSCRKPVPQSAIRNPQSRNWVRFASFARRGLPIPAARAHSWALVPNWVRFAQSSRVPRASPHPAPPEIGFVLRILPSAGPRRQPQGRRPTATLYSIRNIVTPGRDRGPKSAIEELGLFLQPPTGYRLRPFGFLAVSLTRSFYHKKTLLDARLLTQKGKMPQKFHGRPEAVGWRAEGSEYRLQADLDRVDAGLQTVLPRRAPRPRRKSSIQHLPPTACCLRTQFRPRITRKMTGDRPPISPITRIMSLRAPRGNLN